MYVHFLNGNQSTIQIKCTIFNNQLTKTLQCRLQTAVITESLTESTPIMLTIDPIAFAFHTINIHFAIMIVSTNILSWCANCTPQLPSVRDQPIVISINAQPSRVGFTGQPFIMLQPYTINTPNTMYSVVVRLRRRSTTHQNITNVIFRVETRGIDG